MPQFTWTSRDTYDVVRSGIIIAPTAHRAATALAARSIKADAVLPLPERPAHTGPAERAVDSDLDLASIRTADLLKSLRDMVALLRRGVDRLRVFTALGAATHHPVLAEVLQNMGQRTQAGSPLYQAMAAWPGLFDGVVQDLVRHGEGESRLPECIKATYAYLEFKQAMALLDTQLKGKPTALTRAAHEHIVHGRVLACLAAGQRAGLPLDANVELAARHCGDEAVAQKLLEAWQSTAAETRASSTDEALPRALAAAGVVQPSAWKQAASSAPGAELLAALQVLAQARSTLATEATERVNERLRWGLKTALRIGAVVSAVAFWFVLTR